MGLSLSGTVCKLEVCRVGREIARQWKNTPLLDHAKLESYWLQPVVIYVQVKQGRLCVCVLLTGCMWVDVASRYSGG
jgi:hypothetical protein